MARNTPRGTIPIGALMHQDRRTNIPTADAQDFVTPEIEEIRKVRYARDESLDPQLVWRGKYTANASDADDFEKSFVVDAPPIYIQEKIDPRVLMENLRRTAAKPEDEPELTLFDVFDNLDDFESVEFYQHDTNWANRMILGDSLQVMASLAEREKLRGKVQMVYIDPPYGISFGSNWQASVRNRDIKDGRMENAAREVEQIKAFRDTWELGIHSYLSYLRDRLMVTRDLLTDTGSCFVQIGDENLHLVRALMDEVFSSENFCGQFAFRTKIPLRTTLVPAIYDHIVWFAKDKSQVKFRRLFKNRKVGADSQFTLYEAPDGKHRRLTKHDLAEDLSKLPGRLYRLTDLVSAGRTESCVFDFEFDGRTFSPSGNKSWKTNPNGIAKLIAAGRVEAPAKMPNYVFYADDYPVEELDNVWSDTQGASDRVYVVQTSQRVIERCMLMTTDPGDLVIDPTCGSGTSAFVAENYGRRWITIDSSRVALAIARQRLMASLFPWYLLSDSSEGYAKERTLTASPAPRSTFGNDIRHGFVYNRVPHITLGSITNNPDIKPGMPKDRIEIAIKRHAEFELLYDRPFHDTRKVRVTGPFTVESLSPHRALSFGAAPETLSEAEATKDAGAPNFEQSILDNLAKAGIQNGRKSEKFVFGSFETYAGSYIQAVGERLGGEPGSPSRIAIAIGPQYGTVSAAYVKKAAREAIGAEGVELLAILGFAFDPHVTGVTEEDGVTVEATDEGFANVEGVRQLGRIPVLMVRMNADLLMGEELKKTGAGNLFTVFGEPDIELRETDNGWVVDLRGVDVYDPTTGEIRSNDTGQIALWMIDTNYNEESFFVRHCYFTGGNDTYRRLRTALKADINEAAWESLYRTVSLPFSTPETGKIAVKVINDYGDEVMKVFEV